MAHEIRTPLHQIIGFTDLLDQTTNLDADQKSYVKLLKQCSHGLLTVISDVLDYSKLEAGKMKMQHIPYEPKSVVESTIDTVQSSCEEKGIFLTLDWNKNLPFKLCGDPNRLRQILLNLLSNAVKFTDEGGVHISVDFEVTPQTSSTQLSSKKRRMSGKNGQMPKNWIKFVIIDTGMGIPEDHQGLIFNKYHQSASSIAREHGGTGLGLSICKLLLETMGGTMGLDSEVGKGSSFWFSLPVEVPVEVAVVELVEDDTEQQEGKLDILVVEDNKVNQKLVKRMLDRLGHKTTIAENGQVAIDYVQQNSFDLVLMDIQMPVMDGLEATKRLRRLGYTDLQIFGLTASVLRSDFSELGFDDWIPKPVTLKDLKTRLVKFQQSLLQKRHIEPEQVQDDMQEGNQ
jgi:CheY-like chemotaxis protein